jgi:aspartate-semialdehyde dehydrogenase
MKKPGEMLEALRALSATTWLETASVTAMKSLSGLGNQQASLAVTRGSSND